MPKLLPSRITITLI